jgi:ketosteroid isomerase-like protein
MKQFLLISFFILYSFSVNPIFAEENIQLHNELREFKQSLEKALNEENIEALSSFLHPNVVVTWQNTEVTRGAENTKKYIDKLIKGPSSIVGKYSTNINVDELTILYGNTGISFGSSEDHLELREGLTLDLKERWSATLVKEKGKWYIASAHISVNLFDNPILTSAKSVLYYALPIALLIGFTLGFLFRLKRK